MIRSERLKKLAFFLGGTALFSLAYSQAPLYGPNQDQYFLHGLARAGYGFLSRDWLAGTTDPTPLFSLLVEGIYRFSHWAPVFYLLYALLLGVYYLSVIDICAEVFSFRVSSSARWMLALGVVLLHSVLFRAVVARVLIGWGGYVFEDGVADQRILGAVFQPSVFGILLVVSIRYFLKGRPVAAALFAVLAAAFHPTYLLSAAVLTSAYLAVMLLLDRDPKRAILAGGLALLGALPIAAYGLSVFIGSAPETTAEAYRILVHERLPHHAMINYWWNLGAQLKVVIISAALFIVRKHRLFPVLLISALAGAGLTLVQYSTGSDALALIFPWRISAVLLPLASALLIAAAIDFVFHRWSFPRQEKLVQSAAWIGMILLAAAGTAKMSFDFAQNTNVPEQELYQFISTHHKPEEIYLVPSKMEGFRLATGSPIYIDFKSIPYLDLDVLEWYRRIQLINRLYLEMDCTVAQELLEQGDVTHVVLPRDDFPQGCIGLVEIYRDDSYGLYTFP